MAGRKWHRGPKLSNEQFMTECRELVSELAVEGFAWKLDRLGTQCGSPIETRLLAGLLCHLDGHGIGTVIFSALPNPPWLRDADVEVTLQKEIGDYRVDFHILLRRHDRQIIVECDGHDFHERTKEQARRDKARDRWFVTQDIRVLLFTGSEIYRDTQECVAEIANLIEAEYDRDYKPDLNVVGAK